MKQGAGKELTINNVGTSLPSGTQGLDMSTASDGGRKPKTYLLTITVSSGAPIVTLAGCRKADNSDWGLLGEALNDGNALAVGIRHFFVENLGVLNRFGVVLSTGAATAVLAPALENGD